MMSNKPSLNVLTYGRLFYHIHIVPRKKNVKKKSKILSNYSHSNEAKMKRDKHLLHFIPTGNA